MMKFRSSPGRSVLMQGLMPEGNPQERRVTACFTGHRFIAREDRELLPVLLDEALEALYAKGITHFISGAAIGFDTLAARRVLALRDRYPEVRLQLAVPCADQDARWQKSDVLARQTLLDAADETVILSPQYYDGCMQVRNQYMLGHASLVIAYLKHTRGGTMSTVAAAVRRELPVMNLLMKDGESSLDGVLCRL